MDTDSKIDKGSQANFARREIIEPRTLKGFVDRLPVDARQKADLLGILVGTFKSFGFSPIETPHLEYWDVLNSKGGDEVQKQVYRFKDNGGRDVGLRFDLTVPLARFVSQHQSEILLPFRRYAIGSVFRGENPQAGRYREFTQCDIDIIGSQSISADAEIIEVICAAITATKAGPFQVRISSRQLLNEILTALGVEPGLAPSVLRVIDKMDKVDSEKIAQLLVAECGLEARLAEKLVAICKTNCSVSNFSHLYSTLQSLNNPRIEAGLLELQSLSSILCKAGCGDHCFVDLSIARGLGYYTGIVYETRLVNQPSLGSVASGGRYDKLTESFSKRSVVGVGATVGIDRLLAANRFLNATGSKPPAQLIVLSRGGGVLPSFHEFARYFRDQGGSCELYAQPDNDLGKQFSYAERHGYSLAIIVSEDSGHPYTLKRLKERTQTSYSSKEDATIAVFEAISK